MHQCFREQPGSSTVVMYSSSEEGVGELANMLVNDERSSAILVADECSLAARVRLSRRLESCKHRIRCICIDNSTERAGSAAPEFAIVKPSYPELLKILEANFPRIPGDRLRAYAQLSEGFVGLAADMCCYYDDKIRQAGNMGPIAPKLEEYYRERLGTDERMRAVEAISLLKRVRRRGKQPTELDEICRITDVPRAEIEQHLNAIKDAPGFVERGELYYRVTPELIAMIAFEAAWKRWAEGDADRFLTSIPEGIHEAFLERVSEGRDPEVRKTVQGFFRRFADSFTPRDLADFRLVNKLIKIIETDPQTHLPLLRQLVNSATHEDLTCPTERPFHSWGPRRELVWLAEQFVQFPEFFYECEEILYVLATHECENDISNNATNSWQQLFRMQLSGTALSLPSRLDVLSNRVKRASKETADLLGGALAQILSFQGSRLLGPPVVAGRIVPTEWHAKPQEVRGLIVESLNFLNEVVRHPIKPLAEKAKDSFLQNLESLTRQGWVDILRPLVGNSSLDENDRARLLSRLKSIATWGKHPQGTKLSDEYARKLNDWIAELQPRSLHARLIELVGTRSWDQYGREEEWEKALRALAEEMLSDKEVLIRELDWLTSPEANSSFNFGHALGSIDPSGAILDRILAHSTNRQVGFARGYIAGLLYVAGADPKAVSKSLDYWETKDVLFAFQLALAGGERVQVFDRAVRLIAAKKLPAYQLRNFTHWVGSARVTEEQVLTALEILVPRVEADEAHTSDTLMDFLGASLHSGHLRSLMSANSDLFWKAMVAFTTHPGRQEAFWWGETLRFAAPTNPQLSIHLACKALVGGNFGMSDQASNPLSQWASTYPTQLMSELGAIMLDPALGLRFFISKFPVFSVLPLNVVTDWLKVVGSEGAQKIARHLPQPRLDGDGQPFVPELTAWVLSHFEEDDRVFAEFCAGVHSFQMYHGNAAEVHESEAQMARKFLGHPLRRIREWARVEHESARQNAQRQREWDDEVNR